MSSFISRKLKLIEANKNGETPSFGSMLANSIGKFVNDNAISSAQSRITDANRLKKHLHNLYSTHLGLKQSYVSEVLNNYHRVDPGLEPSPTYTDPTTGEIKPTENFHIRLTDWKRKKWQSKEYRNLRRQIAGLHHQFPNLRHLHNDIETDIENAQDTIRSRAKRTF